MTANRSAPAAEGPPAAAGAAMRHLRVAEVADLLLVTPKTVTRWAREGKLPHLKPLGGHRRYPEHEIRELAERMRQTGVVSEAAIVLANDNDNTH